MRVLTVCLFALLAVPAQALELEGKITQGGLIFGKTAPGTKVSLEGRTLRVSPDGDFVFGFGRDAPPQATLRIERAGQKPKERKLSVSARKYRIQRIDGLPPRMVTPPPDVLARIKRENGEIAKVRAEDSAAVHFRGPWLRPAPGPVTGVYGSQRILNGKPRRPHFGIDFAAPVGTPVVAPAGGKVVLAHEDMYYTGGTIILYQGAMIMTHRDVFPGFSARSVRRTDAGHRKASATLPESPGKPPFRSRMRPVGGRRNALPMHHIACGLPPTRRTAYAISMGHYQRSLVLDHGHGLTSAFLHLSTLSVKPGQMVKRGQRIGAIGATGRATGPHLDWRINWFNRRLDPALVLPAEALN